MNAKILSAMIRDGLTVSLAGNGMLKIAGKALTDKQRDFVRQHKPDILREIKLRDFIDLVRITAACDYQIFLHRSAITAALDEATIAELMATRETWERQHMAAGIAYRLTRDRIWEDV